MKNTFETLFFKRKTGKNPTFRPSDLHSTQSWDLGWKWIKPRSFTAAFRSVFSHQLAFVGTFSNRKASKIPLI